MAFFVNLVRSIIYKMHIWNPPQNPLMLPGYNKLIYPIQR